MKPALVWCQAIRASIARHVAIDVFDPVTGKVDPAAKGDEHAESYILVMVTNRLQEALDVPELRGLRKRLPFDDIYALRNLYEHGDLRARDAYARKVGDGAPWRTRGPIKPPQIADVDFGDILRLVDELEPELRALDGD